MLDLGFKLRKKEKGKYIIDDVCFFRIDNETHTKAELVNTEKKEVYNILSVDYNDEICVIPGQERLLDAFEEELTIEEKLKELKKRFTGGEVHINLDSLEYNINTNNIDIKKLSSEVKKVIIGQDEVVDKVLSTIVNNQRLYESDLDYDEIRQTKQSLLIFGKTGTGKTEIVKQIASKLDIPYVVEDATKFTQEGYQARSTSDMLLDLLRITDGNQDLAERGILYIDEIDKKRVKGNESISTTAVQNSLLKIMDGGIIPIEVDPMTGETIDFDTSFLTVILSGAFVEMEKENKRKEIGFNIQKDIKNEEDKYTTEDFINYGMTPEFMGRITSIIKTKDLGYNELKNILITSEISPLNLKKKYLDCLNVTYNFDDEFIDMIVNKAIAKKTGARGLKSAVSDVFDNLGFNLDFEVLAGDIKEIKFEKGKVRKIGARK